MRLIPGFIRKWLFISELPTFPEETYNRVVPLFANINAYLLTFLSVYTTSVITIDAALIILILSSKTIDAAFILGLTFFLVTLLLYLALFISLIKLKKDMIKISIDKNINIEKISYKFEDSITEKIISSLTLSIFLFISFIFFLISASNIIAK